MREQKHLRKMAIVVVVFDFLPRAERVFMHSRGANLEASEIFELFIQGIKFYEIT